ncbi:MAG: ABC transporter ATP-binding protein [Tuberibacillus sp.]
MIKLEHLTKQFHNGKGIFDLNFEIKCGEVFGYLGPNGAGKSTTIRHLMGFIKPTSGRAEIAGFDCWKDSAKIQVRVGYLPGEISFIDGMNGWEFIELMRGMKQMNDAGRRDELIERLQFDVKTPIRKMSKGMKQKVAMVIAFMADPEVLILDEPTSGLDPLMQRLFIDIILEEKQKGKSILMSSHSFQEIERTCDRVAIIKDGKIVAVENMKDLQAKQRKIFEVVVASHEDVVKLEQAGLDIVEQKGLHLRIAVTGSDQDFIQALAACRVENLTMHNQDIEELFMHYYDRKGDGPHEQ